MTASVTGTATDFDDLFAQFRTFITSNATLVGAGEDWTENKYVATADAKELYLEGPGLGGLDNIFVNLRQTVDIPTGYWNLGFRGAESFDGGLAFELQPNASNETFSPVWDNATPYWFVADGRRFIIMLNVNGSFMGCYCGLFLPYATSGEYPYPMYIAANTATETTLASSTSTELRAFWEPGNQAAFLLRIDHTWQEIQNRSGGNAQNDHNCWPWTGESGISSWGPNLDGSYLTMPAVLHSNGFGGNIYGELPGVFWVSGRGSQASENTFIITAENYTVFQGIARTGAADFAAIKME